MELFSASRVKLQRAKKFIGELERVLRAYKKAHPVEVHQDFRRTSPEINMDTSHIGAIPGAIIGDAIHNLRTALDLMASDLVRQAGENSKDAYFPFAKSKEEFFAQVKSKNFHKAGADAVTLLETFAPYRGGNEALRAIHDLDIEDKHTALILSDVAVDAHLSGVFAAQGPLIIPNFQVVVSHVHFVFPLASPFAGKQVIHTLKQLVELVDGIVEAFAALVAARPGIKPKGEFVGTFRQ